MRATLAKPTQGGAEPLSNEWTKYGHKACSEKRSPRGWWSILGHPRGHRLNNRSSKKSFTSPVESSTTHRHDMDKSLKLKTFSTVLVEDFRCILWSHKQQ